MPRSVLTRRDAVAGCAALPLSALAAKPADDAVGPAAFIALSVSDLKRQVAWYSETLGFQVVNEREVPERQIRFALLRREGAWLELLQIPQARPRTVVDPEASSASRIHGFFKGGMVVADLDRLHEQLKARGAAPLAPPAAADAGGLRSFQLRDPEGNLWQFLGS